MQNSVYDGKTSRISVQCNRVFYDTNTHTLKNHQLLCQLKKRVLYNNLYVQKKKKAPVFITTYSMCCLCVWCIACNCSNCFVMLRTASPRLTISPCFTTNRIDLKQTRKKYREKNFFSCVYNEKWLKYAVVNAKLKMCVQRLKLVKELKVSESHYWKVCKHNIICSTTKPRTCFLFIIVGSYNN